MIRGIGTDLVEVARVASSLDKLGDKFARRILGPQELEVFAEHHAPAAYLAKRFAAKEAVAKAMGTGIGKAIAFTDAQVMNNDLGAPSFIFAGAAQQWMQEHKVNAVHLSLSDEQQMAMAFVILESNYDQQ